MKGKPNCPDCGLELEPSVREFIEQMEKDLGIEVTVTSGARCPIYNAKVGGVKNSEHIKSLAVDISCLTSQTRFKIIEYAIVNGVVRLGIGKTFLHLGFNKESPQDVIWLY